LRKAFFLAGRGDRLRCHPGATLRRKMRVAGRPGSSSRSRCSARGSVSPRRPPQGRYGPSWGSGGQGGAGRRSASRIDASTASTSPETDTLSPSDAPATRPR